MSKKVGTQYVCQDCGYAQSKWAGRCPSCDSWNSFSEETIVSGSNANVGNKLQTASLADVKLAADSKRLSSGIGEIDQVLGGGIVPGCLMLLAGEPGIGKSTILLQLAEAIASSQPVLYVSGEESLSQLKLRANRLGAINKNIQLATSNNADDITASVSAEAWGLVVVDSVQTMATANLDSAAGSISQITATTQLLQAVAKQSNSAVLLVGHVTKEGNIAGPKILEHLVDVVLYLEGDKFGSFKLLRGVKNRFGSVDEVGVFEMQETGMLPVKNPSAAFLEERAGGDGSVVLATMEGSRAMLVEIQALVSPSNFGYPKRTASGFDLNRLNLLVAVLSRRAKINLSAADVYVNMVGGMKITEPAADLAVALAIASASTGRPIKDGAIAFGEIGLSGEIRSTSFVDKRIAEARKLGFKRAIAPPSKSSKAFVMPTRSLADAIQKGLLRSS